MTTEQLTDLELDAWIAVKIMGAQLIDYVWYDGTRKPFLWWPDDDPPRGDDFQRLPNGWLCEWNSIPRYSSGWGAAGLLMDHFAAQRRYLWLSYEAESYLAGPDHMVWRAPFAAPAQFHATADSAPRAIALAAKRYTEIMADADS